MLTLKMLLLMARGNGRTRAKEAAVPATRSRAVAEVAVVARVGVVAVVARAVVASRRMVLIATRMMARRVRMVRRQLWKWRLIVGSRKWWLIDVNALDKICSEQVMF